MVRLRGHYLLHHEEFTQRVYRNNSNQMVKTLFAVRHARSSQGRHRPFSSSQGKGGSDVGKGTYEYRKGREVEVRCCSIREGEGELAG